MGASVRSFSHFEKERDHHMVPVRCGFLINFTHLDLQITLQRSLSYLVIYVDIFDLEVR